MNLGSDQAKMASFVLQNVLVNTWYNAIGEPNVNSEDLSLASSTDFLNRCGVENLGRPVSCT